MSGADDRGGVRVGQRARLVVHSTAGWIAEPDADLGIAEERAAVQER